jgi:hypothetical protein
VAAQYKHKQGKGQRTHLKNPLFLFFVHCSDKHSVQESSMEATRMKLILLLIVLTSSWCFVDGASSGDRKSIHGGSDSANKLFRNARRVQQRTMVVDMEDMEDTVDTVVVVVVVVEI